MIYIYGLQGIGTKDIIKNLFPFTYSSYWFITNYIILYFLSTYINSLLKTITQKQHKMLIIFLLLIWCILPSLVLGKINYSEIDLFLLVYIIGAYIKLYPSKIFESKKIPSMILFILSLAGILSIYVLDKLYEVIKIPPTFFALPMNQIIPIGISICLFLIFKNLDIKPNKVINKISSTTLGIYLIHANIFINELLWLHIFKVNDYINSKYLILYEISAVIIVFVVCMLIDFIRQFIFKKLINRIIDFLDVKISKKFQIE